MTWRMDRCSVDCGTDSTRSSLSIKDDGDDDGDGAGALALLRRSPCLLLVVVYNLIDNVCIVALVVDVANHR